MPNAEANATPAKSSKKSVLPVIIVLVALLSAGVGGAIGFWRGAEYGKKRATDQVIKTVADIANPINFLANNPIFPNTIVGKVSQKSDNGMAVKLVNGETKKVNFEDKTQVTKDNKVLSVNDIKNDANVTVFTKATGKDKKTLIATRIILR